MTEKRKARLYDELLGYIVELINDEEELTRILKLLGFTEAELQEEDLLYE